VRVQHRDSTSTAQYRTIILYYIVLYRSYLKNRLCVRRSQNHWHYTGPAQAEAQGRGREKGSWEAGGSQHRRVSSRDSDSRMCTRTVVPYSTVLVRTVLYSTVRTCKSSTPREHRCNTDNPQTTIRDTWAHEGSDLESPLL
jgi:hypothetical protein